MREMNMGSILSATGLAGLGAGFLWIAASRKIHLYWGRRGSDHPFLLVQQRMISLTWGIALVILSFVFAERELWPTRVADPRWQHLKVFVLSAAAAITWLAALLDPRTKALASSSSTARAVIFGNWLIASIAILIAIVNLYFLASG